MSILDLPFGAVCVVGFCYYLIGLLSLVCVVRSFGYPGTGKFIAGSVPVLAVCFFISSAVNSYTAIADPISFVARRPGAARLLSLPVWAAATVTVQVALWREVPLGGWMVKV